MTTKGKDQTKKAANTEDYRCLLCDDLFSSSAPGEQWVQFIAALAGLTQNVCMEKNYLCDECQKMDISDIEILKQTEHGIK